jgi:hypothetical protein
VVKIPDFLELKNIIDKSKSSQSAAFKGMLTHLSKIGLQKHTLKRGKLKEESK